jgi:two-component system NarL family response regulator
MAIRVLLADDHAMVRAGLRAVLSRDAAVEVVGEADSGRAVLDCLRALKPDVVVMDLSMPDLNGLDATRQVIRLLPRAKVIVLTAYTDKTMVIEALDAGAVGFVTKNSVAEELMRAIGAVSRNQTYLCPEIAGLVVTGYRDRHARGDQGDTDVLSEREREVLQLVAEGHTTGAIAGRLHIAEKTVEAHRRNIMAKLDLHSIAELTKFAVRHGITAL